MRAELSQRRPRLRTHAIDAPAADQRREAGVGQKRQQRERERPRGQTQHRQHRARHQHGHERRRNGVREEILDGLDVLRRKRQQVAGAALEQISRRERFELDEEIDAHLGKQAIRHVVRQPGFEPVQQPRERRDDEQRDHQRLRGRTVFDRGNDERAQNADADERGDTTDAAERRSP